jgi:hypothetical protein
MTSTREPIDEEHLVVGSAANEVLHDLKHQIAERIQLVRGIRKHEGERHEVSRLREDRG